MGPLATNAYLITDSSSNQGVIVDPGMQPETLIQAIETIDIQAILLTHAHFDHIGGVDAIRKLKGCPVYLHANEADWLTNAELNGSLRWPELGGPISTLPAEHNPEEGTPLTLLGQTIQVLHTPGHSPGSVTFVWESIGVAFGGDVLFRTSVGRTDLPGGNAEALYRSIHDKLFKLDPDTQVLPGHGPATTIGFEMKHNPYI